MYKRQRLILSRDQVAELMRVFMPEGSNEARLIDQVDTQLNKVVELGFVRRLRGQDGMFEVQRILKAVSYTHLDVYKRQRLAHFER